MTRFQWVAIPLLAALGMRQLLAARGDAVRRSRHLVAGLLWGAAAAAVANAAITDWIAGHLGIGRGADLLLYVFVLVALATGLHFFARIERIESELTRLVRALALEEGLKRGRLRADDESSGTS